MPRVVRICARAVLIVGVCILGLISFGSAGAPGGDDEPHRFQGPPLVGELTLTPSGSDILAVFMGRCGRIRDVVATMLFERPLIAFADLTADDLILFRLPNGTALPEVAGCYDQPGNLIVNAVTLFTKDETVITAQVVIVASVVR